MRKLALKIGIMATSLMPIAALAQVTPPDDIDSPTKIVTIIDSVAGWFFAVFLALAVVFLIWAAFLYLTAAGSQEKVGNAKNALIYAIIAIVVALIAGGLTNIISSILGTGRL